MEGAAGTVGWLELEAGLAAIARSPGGLRAAIARLAARMVAQRGWEALGYARLSDYANERLGRSGRALHEWAQVGAALERSPRLERALARGELPWTKVRTLARIDSPQELRRWIVHARRLTAARLDREVRRVAHCVGSLIEEDREPREAVEIRCTVRVRAKWHYAVELAGQVAGFGAPPGVAAEMIAAEVLSALDPDDEFRIEEQTAVRLRLAMLDGEDDPAFPDGSTHTEPCAEAEREEPEEHEAVPESIAPFLQGIESAGARELDRRLRELLLREQRLYAEVGTRLAVVARARLYLAMGFASLDTYARERLGMDPAKARALLRLERAAARSPELATAYRTGALSWVAAQTLVPLLDSGEHLAAWVERARAVTLQRLRADVERALLMRAVDPERWARTGGLPAGDRAGPRADPAPADSAGADPAAASQEIGAPEPARDAAVFEPSTKAVAGQEIGTTELPNGRFIDPLVLRLLQEGDEDRGAADPASGDCASCAVRFLAPASIAALFRAVHACVQRGLGRIRGAPVEAGGALEAMLDHVIGVWDRRVGTGLRIFERDGWRCAVPGCTSRRSLHDHHIVFRSAGGCDDWRNRIALCAWHHLRGVHRGLVRVTGEAPGRLRFELPLETFLSGDRRIPG